MLAGKEVGLTNKRLPGMTRVNNGRRGTKQKIAGCGALLPRC